MRLGVDGNRPITEAGRPVVEAGRPATEAGRPVTEAGRPEPCQDTHSDTESVGELATTANAQLSLLKEQLERAEAQLQVRNLIWFTGRLSFASLR